MRIDWFTFIAQIINFLVLVFLLRRFLYAPITNAMQEREQRIAERIAAADEQQAAAESATQEYRRRSEDLENERLRMFEQAKQEVEASRRQLLKQARFEVDSRREDWLASLSREQETLTQIIRQRCSEQVTAATTRAIRELADADLEEQMLRSFIQKLSEDDSAGRKPQTKGNATATVITAFVVSSIWKERLRSALIQHFQLASVDFQVSRHVVCGIEVHIGSDKIGWSVEEYVTTLEEEFSRLVEQPTP